MNWDRLDDRKYAPETEVLAGLLDPPPLDAAGQAAAHDEALALASAARRRTAHRQGVVESFLQEFSLGTKEGLALMCLAEALLRIPDDDTRDALIAEKIGSADWAAHLGRSGSLFVNASTWGLMLTGRLVEADDDAKADLPGFLTRLAGRLGEPVIRAAVAQAVRIMGEQFVLGRTIEAAIERARREGLLCSFDMLGEGARTVADAERYEAAYARAIETVGRHSDGRGPEAGHGISVKLSALDPRCEAVQEARVFAELYPRLKRLAVLAAQAVGLLGVQAYQTRAPQVIGAVAELAKDCGRRLMVRLVKGAYWDTEIKRAQVAGRPGYPVFTTKAATDLCYLASARALIDAAPHLYAQFATHNAHTLAAVHAMAAEAGVAVEHQRLHGMGEALYAAAADRWGPLTLRAYAPVGGHEELLPYLVRRLLENGANTSFVHALLDDRVPLDKVITDPIAQAMAHPGSHSRIPLPRDLYGDRRNSMGADLSVAAERERVQAAVETFPPRPLPETPGDAVRSPASRALVLGHVAEATAEQIDTAFAKAKAAQPGWNAIGGAGRAKVLRAMADALEADRDRLIAGIVREAGKTYPDAIGEVREAADFCRYYALIAERRFAAPETLKGPAGEANTLELHGRGVFVCISPWNFPLSIFTGQVAAALAAGNAVLAKPAEQTPLIAREAVRLYHEAGLDPALLQLLSGRGETVGAALTEHPGLDGVAFTGGTETAWAINRTLAARHGPIVPFIAETGGLNAMFVDTTALREQVIDDVILSAFGTAGQRCSALRLLFLPHETADRIVEGLVGAMQALNIGDPADPAVDVGPVIDEDARGKLQAHLQRLQADATVLHACPDPPGDGVFFAPVLAEIPSATFLQQEVFGPILHVVRYDPDRLEEAAAPLAATRYGLTLGVHSRIEAFAERVRRAVPAGNCYVNRSIIGAVVGVQPFGGEGLSGTGPKAGGPDSLTRYAVERAVSVNIAAQGGDPALLNLGDG